MLLQSAAGGVTRLSSRDATAVAAANPKMVAGRKARHVSSSRTGVKARSGGPNGSSSNGKPVNNGSYSNGAHPPPPDPRILSASSTAAADELAGYQPDELEAELSAMPAADLATTLWAYTLTRPYDPELYSAVAQVVTRRMPSFEASSLVDVLCAMAEVNHRDNSLLGSATITLVDALGGGDIGASAMANVSWACALLGYQAPVLTRALALAATEQISSFTPDYLAKLLAAMAESQQGSSSTGAGSSSQARDAVNHLLDAATARVYAWLNPPHGQKYEIPPGPLVKVLHSLARLGFYQQQVFDDAGWVLGGVMQELGPQELSNLAWAFRSVRGEDSAHRSVKDVPLLNSLANAARLKVKEFDAPTLVNLLMAFSDVPHYDDRLYTEAGARLSSLFSTPSTPSTSDDEKSEDGKEKSEKEGVKSEEGDKARSSSGSSNRRHSPQDLVITAWSYSRVQHKATGLMSVIGEQAVKHMDKYDGDDLVHLAAAYPATRCYSPTFFRTLLDTALIEPERFGPQGLMDLAKVMSASLSHDSELLGPGLDMVLSIVQTYTQQMRDKQQMAGADTSAPAL